MHIASYTYTKGPCSMHIYVHCQLYMWPNWLIIACIILSGVLGEGICGSMRHLKCDNVVQKWKVTHLSVSGRAWMAQPVRPGPNWVIIACIIVWRSRWGHLSKYGAIEKKKLFARLPNWIIKACMHLSGVLGEGICGSMRHLKCYIIVFVFCFVFFPHTPPKTL